MPEFLDNVNLTTQLAGRNRMELLLFRLDAEQVFGINVFKVREVVRCPTLSCLPGRHDACKGVAHIRDQTIPIIDTSMALGMAPLDDDGNLAVIITEYCGSTQGFLVRAVDRIVNLEWTEIHPPPRGAGRGHYLTAVTSVDDRLVELPDVEKVLAEVAPDGAGAGMQGDIAAEVREQAGRLAVEHDVPEDLEGFRVLVIDDSEVARRCIASVAEGLGATVVRLGNGKAALEHVLALADEGVDLARHYLLVVCDIEMPELDGYSFTAAVRADERTRGMYILLHSSLSGQFNRSLVEKVGGDDFLPKFCSEELARRLLERAAVLGRPGTSAAA